MHLPPRCLAPKHRSYRAPALALLLALPAAAAQAGDPPPELIEERHPSAAR